MKERLCCIYSVHSDRDNPLVLTRLCDIEQRFLDQIEIDEDLKRWRYRPSLRQGEELLPWHRFGAFTCVVGYIRTVFDMADFVQLQEVIKKVSAHRESNSLVTTG